MLPATLATTRRGAPQRFRRTLKISIYSPTPMSSAISKTCKTMCHTGSNRHILFAYKKKSNQCCIDAFVQSQIAVATVRRLRGCPPIAAELIAPHRISTPQRIGRLHCPVMLQPNANTRPPAGGHGGGGQHLQSGMLMANQHFV